MNKFPSEIIDFFEALRTQGHAILGVHEKTLKEANISYDTYNDLIRKCSKFILNNYSKNKDYYDSI